MLRNIIHYIQISRSGLFDRYYYLKKYPDVRKKDIDPLWHFVAVGWREGRNPSKDFDVSLHLNKQKITQDTVRNPLIQHIKNKKTIK